MLVGSHAAVHSCIKYVSAMALPLTGRILCYEIVAEELMQADRLSQQFVQAVVLLMSG